MRVTSRSMVDTVVRNLQAQAQQLDKLQNQISSGKRITRPADDPVAAWRGLRMRREHAANEQHLRNMDEARNWLLSNDRVLSGTNAALAKVRELAVQGADDAYSAVDRKAIAREVSQLKAHMLSLFNGTQHVGQLLYGGRKTTTQAFDTDAGGNVVYNGETGITIPVLSSDLAPANGVSAITLTDVDSAVQGAYRVAVAAPALGATSTDVTITRYDALGVAVPGATQTITVDIPTGATLNAVDFDQLGLTVTFNGSLGTLAFAESATSELTAGSATVSREIGDGVELPVNMLGAKFLTMFQNLNDLEKALGANDQVNISKGIQNLDVAINLVSVAQTEIGTRMNRLEAALDRLTEHDIEVVRIRGEAEDVDMTDALTRLTTQQTIYRAALQTGAQSIPLSILDFLR